MESEVLAFTKGISLKINETAWLEFRLAYFEDTVQHFVDDVMEAHFPCLLRIINSHL